MEKKLSLDNKIRLLNGDGDWHTYAIPGVLPAIMMTDGPHGLRKQDNVEYADINDSRIATCFPTASCIASSWDRHAVALMGDAIAKEALAEKVSIVLGCGINIKRSPLCGRNFEYFSEDPFLTGELAASFIKGVQQNGVGTSLKHFACNNQEKRRQTSESIIDERTLREIYLSAFEKTVKEAQPATVMCSYNKLNGGYVSQSRKLLTDILRTEWGFKGLVVSDWGAAIQVPECIKAGLDLAMPDSHGYHQKLLEQAVKNGTITEEDITRAAERVISLVENYSAALQDTTVDYAVQHQKALSLAAKSAVLLKNSGVLPLPPPEEKKKITVLGTFAEKIRFQGGGSSHINTAPQPNAIQALEAAGYSVIYCDGTDIADIKALAARTAAEDTPLLVFAGLPDSYEGEGFDRTSLNMPLSQQEMISAAAQENPAAVVVTFSGSPVNFTCAEKAGAILHMYLAGEAAAEAAVKLLTGAENPSGRLAETFPLHMEDTPCNEWFAKETDIVEYREGVFTGYRWYESLDLPVSYEFGYGLSYTDFSYSNLRIAPAQAEQTADGKTLYTVTFTVTNTGSRAGNETVQLYVRNPGLFTRGDSSSGTPEVRPLIELKGFEKVYLQPGENRDVTLTLTERSFSVYSSTDTTFMVVDGDYTICVGKSVRKIELSEKITVNTGSCLSTTDEVQAEKYKAAVRQYLTKEAFETRLGHPVPAYKPHTRGNFVLSDSFGSIAAASLLGRTFLTLAKKIIYAQNKDKPKDDPAIKIILTALDENPLESLISTSGGVVSERLAHILLNAANGKWLFRR